VSAHPGYKVGLRLDLYKSAGFEIPYDTIRHVEALGFDSVWTAEAYGADALTPLAAIGAAVPRIRLGTSVVQLAARPPATLAMQAMTVDAIAGGGRVVIGIGLSGPQIVEGWYGQPWGRPNARLRDYLEITRKMLDREGPVTHDGPEIQLPYRGPGALGQGKPLRSILHPPARIPLWLGTVGPKNTELCAELCDGWFPMGLGRDGLAPYDDALDRGFAQRTDGRSRDDFEVFGSVNICITDDVQAWIDREKPWRARYVGGMGSSSHNYHVEAMARRGYGAEAARIQELFLAGRRDEAVAAMPDEYVLEHALVGSPQRIRELWEQGSIVPPGVTGFVVGGEQPEALDLIADLVGTRDR
jgi:F420-dependent oxidoreductase-like protein